MKIEVHSRDGCPYCVKAVDWLTERSIPFTEIKHNDYAERQTFYDSLGLVGGDRTVPQVIVETDAGRERVGGYTQLVRSGLQERHERSKEASGREFFDDGF